MLLILIGTTANGAFVMSIYVTDFLKLYLSAFVFAQYTYEKKYKCKFKKCMQMSLLSLACLSMFSQLRKATSIIKSLSLCTAFSLNSCIAESCRRQCGAAVCFKVSRHSYGSQCLWPLWSEERHWGALW